MITQQYKGLCRGIQDFGGMMGETRRKKDTLVFRVQYPNDGEANGEEKGK